MQLIYLLDTDIWSLWTLRQEPVASRVKQNASRIAISIVLVNEVFHGWIKKIKNCRQHDLVKLYSSMSRSLDAIKPMPTLPFDEQAFSQFYSLRLNYRGKGSKDLQMASIALAHKLTLVTNNTKDYEDIQGLRLENWNS
jgi:tRNA(fMet)-specific endonuclease VapC